MSKTLRQYRTEAAIRTSKTDAPISAATGVGGGIEIEEEFETILASIIDENYIMSVTGVRDLSRVEYISLVVDTRSQSIYCLPEYLPNLKHLVLDNSRISSIRDLGTQLRYITSLSLSGCNLNDLDGIGVLSGLQELCLSDNLISDVSPLTMHENLQNLNLSGNRVSDLSFGLVLASCASLRSLFLGRNPIDRIVSYRAVVSYLIPGLEMLDGSPLDASLGAKINSSVVEEAKAELVLIQEEIEAELRLDEDIYNGANFPGKVDSHSQSTLYATASRLESTVGEVLPDTGSELTHGSAVVLAGNVAAAMRRRRNKNELDGANILEVLDSGLGSQSGAANAAREFVREGDITSSLLGTSPSSPSTPTNKDEKQLYFPMTSSSPAPTKGSQRQVRAGAGVSSLSFSLDRPKSAFSGSTLRASDKSHQIGITASPPDKSSALHSKPAPSPRQRNGSRPQSAAAMDGNALFIKNLPFAVVSTDKDDADNDRDSESEDMVMKDKYGQNRERRRLVGFKEEEEEAAEKTGSSLVHLNMVRRGQNSQRPGMSAKASNRAGVMMLPSTNDSDNSDEEDDVALSHVDRLRKASSSAGPGSNANLLRARQSVLQRLQGAIPVRDHHGLNKDEVGSLDLKKVKAAVDNVGSSTGSTKNSARSGGVSTPRSARDKDGGRTVSSQVGQALGFNLIGSLAAIDRWAQEASSEDENEGKTPSRQDDADNEGEKVIEHETPRDNEKDDFRDKILTRDAIIQLCWGGKRDDSAQQGTSERIKAALFEEEEPLVNPTDDYNYPAHSSRRRADDQADKQVKYSRSQATLDSVVPIGQRSRNNSDSANPATAAKQPVIPKASSSSASALGMSDKELVELLRKPPKTVVALRTKAGFQEFFRDIEIQRFRKLLNTAYDDILDPEEREAKISRRLSLMEGSAR